jgi:putative transcriptional regulator
MCGHFCVLNFKLKYNHNKFTRLDIEVLARLCTALDCGIEDILEYVPPKK